MFINPSDKVALHTQYKYLDLHCLQHCSYVKYIMFPRLSLISDKIYDPCVFSYLDFKQIEDYELFTKGGFQIFAINYLDDIILEVVNCEVL